MGKVRVGFFSFTEITDPAEHRSYNAWHQLDHMPEQYPLRGVVYGQRWVCTPACRRARAVDGGALAPIHYLTVYLMADPVHTTLREFQALADRLHDEGRFHTARRARLAGPFVLTGARAAPRVQVSAQSVPYRPTKGVYLVVRSWSTATPDPTRARPRLSAADRAADRAAERAAADQDLAARLGADAGVAGVWSFSSHRRFDRHSWRTGDLSLTLCYLDDEPLAVAARLAAVLGGQPDVIFAGPFETITPWRWDWFDGAD